MREHVFLCGLSAEQKSEHSGGVALSLDKNVGNLKLRLEQMRKRLVGNEPKRLTDFVEIASYVFAADRTTGRGPLSDPGFGARWRRNFHLVVAVRDVAFWQRQDVQASLCDALGFLSEDCWRFEFIENLNPIELNEYLGLNEQGPDSVGETSIVLFSGGLDSLAGAVHELEHTNKRVVLVSHRNQPLVGNRQVELAKKLAVAHAGRVTHVWVGNSLTSRLREREATQRTRSLFFTAIAAVAAHIEKSDRIRFYENGVMSVNLPFATQIVGARASRSTHPRSLQLIGRVVDLVSIHPIEVDNPFAWMTKVEVVSELARSKHSQLITRSLSCTRSRTANKTYKPHCGSCIQCLQRRISTLAGGAAELDEAEGYDTDFLIDPRKDGRDRAMVVGAVNLALDCASISERDFKGRHIEPVSWVLQAYPPADRDEVAKKVCDLYRRHGTAVRDILIEAAKPRVPAMLDRALPPSSLLAMVMASKLSDDQIAPVQEPPSVSLAEAALQEVGTIEGENFVFIAFDPKRHRIMISDRPELHGHAIFPIMKLLIEMAMKDRGDGLLPRNYRCFHGKEIAAALGNLDEGAVRAAIKRAREDFDEAALALDGVGTDPNAIIETVSKRGYRINPNVMPLTVDEFRRR